MYIIIPAYEPDQRLVDLVATIRQQLRDAKVILINDGSNQRYQPYFEGAEQLGATLLSHSENRGKGAALKTAFSYLLANGGADKEDYLITIDSDGQHLVSDMLKVADAVKDKPSTLVLGCRAFVGDVPTRSRFGNMITAKLFGLVTGQALSDTQTGLRAMSTHLLPWLLSLEGDRFEYEFNMLLEAKRANVTIEEVPIETIYLNHNEGSHFRPIRDSIRIYTPFLKFSGTALTAAVADAAFLFLLMSVTNHLLLSVVLARVLSAGLQWSLNAQFVFNQGTSRPFRSLIRYFSLVLVLLACNFFLLQSLVGIGIGLALAKLVTETLLFILSYRVQRNVVFT
ncbi:bifunctional glycosyltransferase family 2/GtrA family protein [Streptococcus plurextorum]|uniref:bifunctional glycosyltransferase family 2/GtrA family protein n=1 Tax=Streptococcus plurextorum TaxID=456876 RepID=UPI00041F506C|nr:bifunctional glycosyltransferase family 2/GtrA family protein [Streptococcus plurextorum]